LQLLPMIAIDFGALRGSVCPSFFRRTVDAAPIVLMILFRESLVQLTHKPEQNLHGMISLNVDMLVGSNVE
jgi:uncharacterized membrane protein